MWRLNDVDGMCFPNKYSFVKLFRVAPRIRRLRACGTCSDRVRVGVLQESVSHHSRHYTNPIPLLNTSILHIWLRLTLAKPRPSFSQTWKKKYPSGQPIKAIPGDVSFPNIASNFEILKIFLQNLLLSSDDPHHLFFYCPFTRNLISHLEPLLTSILKKPTSLIQDTLLLNYTNTTGTPHTS